MSQRLPLALVTLLAWAGLWVSATLPAHAQTKGVTVAPPTLPASSSAANRPPPPAPFPVPPPKPSKK